MFDATLQVVNATIVEQEKYLELQMVLGISLGEGVIPGGVIRVPLGRDVSLGLGKDLLEKGENLPEPPKKSDIVVPSSGADVAQAAKLEKALRDGTER